MRVSLVDPSAQTPPYDRSLAAALARAGLDVELLTSHFLYAPVPAAEGYEVSERFYRRAAQRGLGSRLRLPVKIAEHFPDMLAARRRLASADVVHWQWLTLPRVDRLLVGGPAGQPHVFTLHYPLPRPGEGAALRRQRRILERFDAVVVHTEQGAERLRAEVGLEADRVHVIPHGPFDYLTRLPDEQPLVAELAAVEGPVILFFGLLRPYKGIDTLIDAFARLGEGSAELWIAGRPTGMDIGPLREAAARAPGTVRFLDRFIPDTEIPALMRRADVLALPYREIEQSGVLHTGLAFGKSMVLGDVGGFGEFARRHDAARLVPPGDPAALAAVLAELLADPDERRRLSEATQRASGGPHSWDAIAARTRELYESLLSRHR
jgi:glycosyltransferase involved in cell wall biosynthesis